MKIVVVTTNKPGISTTLLGEQVISGLGNLGVEVVPCYVSGKEGEDNDLKELHQMPVVCLVEHVVPSIMNTIRYIRPKCLLSVWVGNWEGYDDRFRFSYISTFMKAKAGGVPVQHVSHSYHTDTMIKTFSQKYFKTSVVRAITKQMIVQRYGIEDSFVPGNNPDPDSMIVPYNRVLQSSKNIRLHAEVMLVYAAYQITKGRNVTSTFYHAEGFGPDSKDTEFDRSAYTFRVQPKTRDEFRANAQKNGMFLCTSNWESFGLYYLELMASGSVGVFLDRPWVRKLLPDYPYIVPSSNLKASLSYVRDNYKDVRDAMLQETVPFIRETYSIPKFCEGIKRELLELVDLDR